MLKGKLIAMLQECPWLLEQTMEDLRARTALQEQLNRKLAELEGEGHEDSRLPAGRVRKAA